MQLECVQWKMHMHLHEDVNSFDFVLNWPTASRHQNETKQKKGKEQEENKKKKKQQNEKIE